MHPYPSPGFQAGASRTLLVVVLLAVVAAAIAAFVLTGPHPLSTPALAPEPSAAATQAQAKPNLLVIMTDDLDQGVFDLMLKSGWLPHIRRGIVEPGLSFDNSFVSDSACCPSRATYLTGQYPKNHGILSVTMGAAYWYLAKENREDRTLPVMLHEAGYYTGHIGKYLNGYGMFSSREHLPRGYDEWYGLVDPSTYDMFDYAATLARHGGKPQVLDFHADHRSGADYQTDRLGDWALDFLDGARASGRPFYLTLDPVSPHIESHSFDDDPKLGYRAVFREYIRPAPRHECLVRQLMPEYVAPAEPGEWCDRALPDSLAYLAQKPSFNQIDPGKHPRLEAVLRKLTEEGGDLGALKRQHQFRMAAMIAVDDLVGRVLARLDALQLTQDTLIVFTSDNGYLFGEHGMNSKLLPYEESIRVPLVIRLPGGRTGRTPAIALNNDLAPTLADFAGAHPLRESDAFDGRSLRSVLQRGSDTRRQLMVEHFIESTSMELAAEIPLYKDLSEAVTSFLGKLAGFEFGALGNLSYPAYKAIRRQVAGDAWLYVQWYAELSNRKQGSDGTDAKVDFEELYDLDRDPYQRVNLLPLAQDHDDARMSAALAKFRADMEAFKACHAQACRQVEDR